MLRTLVKDSAVYAVGTIASRLVGFIMIPVYTRVLTPADYGIIETIVRLVDIIGLLLSLGLAEALLRHYYLAKTDDERNRLIGTVFNLNLLVVAAGVLVFWPLSPWLTRLAFGHDRYTHYVAVSLIGMMIGSLIELPLTLWRAEGKPWRFTAISLLKLFTHLSANIVLVVWLRWGVWGVVISGLLNAVVWSVVLGVMVRLKYGIYFDKGWLASVLRYGVPLVPAGLSQFVLHYSDRFFLVRYVSESEVGLYSLAYRFGMLVIVLYKIISLAWNPWAYRLGGSQEQGGLHLARATSLILISFACVSAFVALIAAPAIRLMSAPAFWEAGKYVALLSLAYWFFMAQGLLSTGARLARRTGLLAAANGLAAAVCLLLSWWLIPHYGVWGAVVMTVLSMLTLVGACYVISQKAFAVEYDKASLGLAFALACVPGVYNLMVNHTGILDMTLRIATCAGIAAVAAYWMQARRIVRLPSWRQWRRLMARAKARTAA
jgi:O-antigen/teichoic acid export membrane protein